MNKLKDFVISDYDYPLQEERIAKYPLENRDNSKLLFYKDGKIEEKVFYEISEYLPESCLLVGNETKVIQARLIFKKLTGAIIEIFCLEPVEPTAEVNLAFSQKKECVWKCFVGNNKKWKNGELLLEAVHNNEKIALKAEKLNSEGNAWNVRFSWTPESYSFSEILEVFGKIPLPPYLNRDAEDADLIRYQTVFARNEGSVAAPTAGLHFTEKVFQKLDAKNIKRDYLTLHVGAGTFKPVSTDHIEEHEMHTEQVFVEVSTIKLIKENLKAGVYPIGTTSVRTIESLFWHGAKLISGLQKENYIDVKQWDPYSIEADQITVEDALQTIIDRMENDGIEFVKGATQLMIAPGYKYKVISGMITNFHQPKSTLLLLVSALIGDDWKKVYNYALDNDFRFLSYGDSCLFFKHD